MRLRLKRSVRKIESKLPEKEPSLEDGSEEDGQIVAQSTEKKAYNCTQCDYSYESKKSLRHHMNIHKQKFPCQHCGKCFQGSFELKRHLKFHTEEKPFFCPKCAHTCIQRSDLIKHFASCIKSKQKSRRKLAFLCRKCDKGYSREKSLREHQRTHSDRHKCDVCGKCCSNALRLLTHQRIHTGEKPFGCEKCEYRTGDKSHLSRHKKACKKRNRSLSSTDVKPVNSQKFEEKEGPETLGDVHNHRPSKTENSVSSESVPRSPVEEKPPNKKRVMRKDFQEMVERMKQQVLHLIQRVSAESNMNPMEELLGPDLTEKDP